MNSQHGAAVFLARDQQQAPPPILAAAGFLSHQRRQRLLACRPQALRHRRVPAVARREGVEELRDLRQVGEIGAHLQPAAAGGRQLHEQGHQDRHQAARRHAVLQQAAGEFREVLGVDTPFWKPTPAQNDTPTTRPLR